MSDAAEQDPNFAEIRDLLPTLPGPDLESGSAAATLAARLRRQGEELGRLAEHVEWLAAWQGRTRPGVEVPRIAVFAANHGIARRLAAESEWGTGDWVEATVAGKTALNRVATELDADLRIYELALEQPSGDFTSGPALSEADCARAMAYGMMTVEEGFDLMVIGGFGLGNESAARALAAALLGETAETWGAGDAETAAIAEGLARHGGDGDGLDLLRAFGGLEMAAAAGALIACRLARLPVVLDGFAALAAGAALWRLDDRLLGHCRAASGGSGAYDRLRQAVALPALSEAGATAGSGLAGAASLPVLRAAVRALAV